MKRADAWETAQRSLGKGEREPPSDPATPQDLEERRWNKWCPSPAGRTNEMRLHTGAHTTGRPEERRGSWQAQDAPGGIRLNDMSQSQKSNISDSSFPEQPNSQAAGVGRGGRGAARSGGGGEPVFKETEFQLGR